MSNQPTPQLAGTANVLSAICLTPVPLSYIPAALATARINNFRNHKRGILTDQIRDLENQANPAKEERPGIRYSRNEFTTLAGLLSAIPHRSGLRVYFASYIRTGDPNIDRHIPAGAENLLTLIFSCTQQVGNNHVDNGFFFIVAPDSTNESPKIIRLHTQSIRTFPWVLHYESKAVALQRAPDYAPAAETRSVWFEGNSFIDWEKEILCMEERGIIVDGIFIAFAGYNATETVTVDGQSHFVGHQLTLVITVNPGFNEPTEPASFFFNMEEDLFFNAKVLRDDEGFDTSVPCPPAVCG